MLLSPSSSPSPFDSPSTTTTISPPPPPLPPPEVVVQPPLPLLSPPSQVTPHLSPTSTPPIPPPVLPGVTSPPPAAVAISPVSIPSPPTTPPAASTISPIPITSPVSPPPPASVIIPSPLLPKSSSPPPQPSKPLPSTPPSVNLPPSRPPPQPSKPLPSTSPSVILPPPLTTPPSSLPPPRPLPSVSQPPPAASHSIGSPNTTPASSRAFPLPPPAGASHSIGHPIPNTPGFFQAYPQPGPPPLTSAVGKGGLPTTKQTPHSPIGLIVACIGVGILLFAVVFALVCICCKGRRRKQKPLDTKNQVTKDGFLAAPIVHKQENFAPSGAHVIELNPATLTADTTTALNSSTDGIFTYEELVIATDGFSESNLLGQGGFGYVYKGLLPTGQDVAVKKLKVGSRQGEREFQAEVETISRVHHKHLVSLVGYCINGDERLLVYEFVPNKTLEFHLHENGQPVIAWESRLKIAIGSAKGLAYLHEDCSPTIIHRDIKAANILLDMRFEAKVSDFGLAKIFFDASSSITHISTRVMGTFGYLAPEYALTGKLTDKSDVYSYGVMLLEIITGRPPIIEQDSSTNQSLVDWARPLLARALEDHDFDTLVDRRLNGSYNKSKMASMVSCAAACIRQSAWLRPRMIQVVRALEDDISLPYHDEGMRVSKSSSNASSDTFVRNAKRCINNGGCSENYETTTTEYGI